MPTEQEAIAAFLKPFPKASVPVGPGDDAAVVAVVAGRRDSLCVTTDALVENVHFTRRDFTAGDVGHKALAVNLSDLAAMGARPEWFVCAVGMPARTPLAYVRGMAAGMAALARAHRIALVGGNFSRARELSLTLTCAGSVPPKQALLRSGGRPGDLLFVSGALGDARAGLFELREGARTGAAVKRQRRPEPRVALGLIARRFAQAAMDISDGLARDLPSLCRASGVGADLELERLPVGAAARRRCASREEAAQLALVGGEDYELLLAVHPSRAKPFERACVRHGQRVTCVGRLSGEPGVRFLWGEVAMRPPAGFDHFA